MEDHCPACGPAWPFPLTYRTRPNARTTYARQCGRCGHEEPVRLIEVTLAEVVDAQPFNFGASVRRQAKNSDLG